MAQQEGNRLQSGLHSPAVRASLEATLAFLRQEVVQMQRLVQAQVEQSADLPHQQRLLCSILGIGRWTATQVLAESEQGRLLHLALSAAHGRGRSSRPASRRRRYV
jgi:hypothetical protein